MISLISVGPVSTWTAVNAEYQRGVSTPATVFLFVWGVVLQFAFTELMTDMKQPLDFPKAISVCTCIMSTLYAGLGAAGYWSKGLNVADIVIFSLGESPLARFAAGCILVQVSTVKFQLLACLA